MCSSQLDQFPAALRIKSWTPLLAVMLLAAAPSAQADDRIWCAVVIASNSSNPKPPPAELKRFAARMQRVFGYNQFELFGSATKTIDDSVERWLVPSQNFWLCVKSKQTRQRDVARGYDLDLQLFHDKRRLVETDVTLAFESPVFIRGPLHASGQILIVLQILP